MGSKMDDSLFVLFPPMGGNLVFFLLNFLLGVPVIKSHDVIGIIIYVISIIFIVYIFNFDTNFGVIPSFTVFGHVFGSCRSCDICCIRYAILVLRRVVTRFLISRIFLIYISCIVSVDINYLCKLIF